MAVISIFTLLISIQIFSQKTVFGLVTNDKNEIIPGALVFWKNAPERGTATDSTGHFWLKKINDKKAVMTIRFVGYEPTEVEVLPEEDSIWVEIKGVTNLSGHIRRGPEQGSVVGSDRV